LLTLRLIAADLVAPECDSHPPGGWRGRRRSKS